jgi:glycosyltransferase involved in cell wall biosynthesis
MNIIFYCGKSHENWSPKSIKTGIGGSEEATIYLAEEFVKLGHKVVVYNQCGQDAGTYNGVEYKSYLNYMNNACDVLIVWRSPTLHADIIKLSKAKQTYLWLHDTISEYEVLPIINMVNKVIVLSTYHQNLYSHIPFDKLMVSQNGVNLSQFDKKVKRNPKKIIWTSSYDRGLKELLEMWTAIKLSEPEAELHIYYGWNTMEKILGKNSEQYKIFRDVIEQLFDQEGVYHHGRVGHKEIAETFLSAGVWAYPTSWPEISCISAMKAQVAGAIPVVIPTAAVSETVKWGLTTNWSYDHFNSDNLPEKILDNFADLTIKALDEKFQKRIRRKMMEDARSKYSWGKVAREWTNEFLKTKQEQK